MSYKQFIYLVVLCLSVNAGSFGATVITGDAGTSTQTFSFPINQFAYSNTSGAIFTGAGAGSSNNFSVALAMRNATSFVGLTPSTVALNNIVDQENPLFNQQVAHLGLAGIAPLVSLTIDPTIMYVIQDYNNLNAISVLATPALNDATGAVTSGIGALGSDTIKPIIPSTVSTLMALVASNGSGGVYGSVGSGVAVGILQKIENSNPVQYSISTVNAVTGEAGNQACPLDKTSTALKNTNDLTSLTNPVLYYDDPTGIFFAGFTADPGVGGARAVVRILGSTKISLGEITPTAALQADSIIGTNDGARNVTIYDLKTMSTSTNVEYLLVLGGTKAVNGQRSIFALPLVTTLDNNVGVLANINVAPITQFSPNPPYLFVGRGFVTPATAAGQLYDSTSVPAIVGGGELPGDVTAMTTYNDAVIASIAGGVYITQALFDTNGAIAKWTPWVRAAGTTANIYDIAIEPLTGNFIYANGATSSTVNTIQRTGWSKTGVVQTAVEPFFDKDSAGIQGFFNYPNVAVSLGGSGTAASMVIATGYNKVSLVQTGVAVTNSFVSIDGSLTGFSAPAQQITISGGALADLGAITSAALVQVVGQAWLFVGGNGGLAVLANDDGSGFDPVLGVGAGFSNLTSTMKFRKVGNYSNVRKLLPVYFASVLGDYTTIQTLHILTPAEYGWSQISQAALAIGGTWSAGTFASASSLVGSRGTFSDVAVSVPLAILATSKGLYRIGNDVDVTTFPAESEANWTQVSTPESPGPVTRLVPLSPTLDSNDFGQAGNLYALAAAVSTSQARLYRFVVNIVGGTVTDTTVQLFPDYYHAELTDPTVGSPTFFTSLGDYRNYFSTNGSHFYFSRSAYLDALPIVHTILVPLRTGTIGLGNQQGPILTVPGYRAMGQLVSSSATGSMYAYGDFGLQANE